ncbi:hypothetical protein [Peribacillus sp. Hz7]|uniref:hypothetical protein n=1 Tax=Peribacillus sp. Hz7 TaxID=3344873 RepID=UPI0035CB75CB
MTTNYRNELKEIQGKLDKGLSVEERIKIVDNLLEYEGCKDIYEYISSEYFRGQNGRKKKTHQRYEETYLAIGLSNISDYELAKWNEWQHANAILDDYEIMSKYDINRIASAGENKWIIGLDTSVADDYLENGVSKTVLQGWELHVDRLESNTNRSNEIFNFSEVYKRGIRNKAIVQNLEKYPTLLERYTAWNDIGLKYGFSADLTKEQKGDLKNKWLEVFGEENNPIKPKERYYRLQKMYNNIGYELSVILDEFRKPVKRHIKSQLKGHQHVEDTSGDFILGMVNLSIQDHVNGLLTIQKGNKVGEYFPLYQLLKVKHENDIESPFNIIAAELIELLHIADLTELERDIVYLITENHESYNVFNKAYENANPYELIATYINEKYDLHKTKTDIKKMVSGRISKTLANAYQDLENGVDAKGCTQCNIGKLASKHNFGVDSRKKDGLKSVCKKCASKNEENRRKLIDINIKQVI